MAHDLQYTPSLAPRFFEREIQMHQTVARDLRTVITVRRTPALTKAFTYPAGCLSASTTTGAAPLVQPISVVRRRILLPLTKALSYPSPQIVQTDAVAY